jgi:hypothetical protein
MAVNKESTNKVLVSKAKETTSAVIVKKLECMDAAQEFTYASTCVKTVLNAAASRKAIKNRAQTNNNRRGALVNMRNP